MHDDNRIFPAQALVNGKVRYEAEKSLFDYVFLQWKRRDLTLAPCSGCSATLLVISKKCKKCHNKAQATPATCHSAQHHRKHHITTLYAVDTFGTSHISVLDHFNAYFAGNNDRQHSRTLAIAYNNDIATCSAHIPPHDMHAESISHLPLNIDIIHLYLAARDRDTLVHLCVLYTFEMHPI